VSETIEDKIATGNLLFQTWPPKLPCSSPLVQEHFGGYDKIIYSPGPVHSEKAFVITHFFLNFLLQTSTQGICS
ncbi:MAG: hypothetical protein AAFV07_18735, partial [Bacteroidota bacterium]